MATFVMFIAFLNWYWIFSTKAIVNCHFWVHLFCFRFWWFAEKERNFLSCLVHFTGSLLVATLMPLTLALQAALWWDWLVREALFFCRLLKLCLTPSLTQQWFFQENLLWFLYLTHFMTFFIEKSHFSIFNWSSLCWRAESMFDMMHLSYFYDR